MTRGYYNFREYYAALADRIPANGTWVEVGVFNGHSLIDARRQLIARGKPNVRLVGVDLLCCTDGPPRSPAQHAADLITRLDQAGVWPAGAQLLLTSSIEAAALLGPNRADVVFIDASHDYPSVRADIPAWRTVLKPGGILCGHDYCLNHGGVWQAVTELCPGHTLQPGGCWEWINTPVSGPSDAGL